MIYTTLERNGNWQGVVFTSVSLILKPVAGTNQPPRDSGQLCHTISTVYVSQITSGSHLSTNSAEKNTWESNA